MATEITSVEQYEKDVKGSNNIVVIDFWAPWCGPCKSYKPVFEKVAEEGIDGVDFYSLDIDVEELEDVVDEFGISGVPYTAIIKNGEVIADKAGLMMKADLVNFIEEAKQ
ncbi:MAG: thioredoxin family protein [Candidatus Nanoarchaeia archaeon]